jgi:NADPH2:quinone reductase
VRAAICREYGPPEVVRVEDLPSPPLGPGQVRVGVRAAAVGYPDVLLVAGQHPVRRPVPFIPGSEYAGIVTEVAGDVVRPKIGERVFGTTGAGAFGRELVVAAGAVRAVPAGLNDRVAAAFGVAHRLAYHVLRTVACLQPGEELVVLGAGGGVGLATVQIGAGLGASVTAVSSSAAKLEAAAVAGARHLVDHRGGDLREALARVLPGGADVVVDPVGGTLAEPALEALRWAGRFVTVGYASGVIPRIPLNLVLLNGIRVLGIQLRDLAVHRPDEVHRNEEELMGLLAGGYVTPHVGAVFGLDQAAAALRYVADGRAIGTVVLDVASPCLASPCLESPCLESPCLESQWPESAGMTAST